MDKKFSEVHFMPWVGKRFEGGLNGHRILVLGESAYCWDENGEWKTPQKHHATDMVQWRLNDREESERHPFLRNIEHAFCDALGLPRSIASAQQVWNGLAFHEYVQEPMTAADKRPTAHQWRSSREPLIAVLESLRPDLLFVMGYTMWSWLPESSTEEREVHASTQSYWTCDYELGSGPGSHQVTAYRFRHPSRGFSIDKTAEVFKTILTSPKC